MDRIEVKSRMKLGPAISAEPPPIPEPVYDAEAQAWAALEGCLPGTPGFDADKWSYWLSTVREANERVAALCASDGRLMANIP